MVGEAHRAAAGEGEPGILQRKAMQIRTLTSTEPLVLELWVDFLIGLLCKGSSVSLI